MRRSVERTACGACGECVQQEGGEGARAACVCSVQQARDSRRACTAREKCCAPQLVRLLLLRQASSSVAIASLRRAHCQGRAALHDTAHENCATYALLRPRPWLQRRMVPLLEELGRPAVLTGVHLRSHDNPTNCEKKFDQLRDFTGGMPKCAAPLTPCCHGSGQLG